jgi:transcriptional regulator with XRE-family HTH domain
VRRGKTAAKLPNTATFPRYFCCPAIVTLFITHSKPNLSLTKTKMPNINSSLLALRRKRLGYEQKQIAVLLGHKPTYQISRYETGQRIPSLKEAMKLSILYGLPLRALFKDYFRRCREELEKTIKQSGLADKIKLENAPTADYCSSLELMNSAYISERNADKIRHHIKVLVEERSEKILGN